MTHAIYLDGKLYGTTSNYLTAVADIRRLMAAGVENTRLRFISTCGDIPATM